MHRTNIYLTDAQVEALDAEAEQGGTTRSELVRTIIDQHVASKPAIDPDVAAAFAEIADVYDEITEHLFDDDPDLRIER
jgi:metal-responsive CopG/Arc/MetJ family transcriptional regulator